MGFGSAKVEPPKAELDGLSDSQKAAVMKLIEAAHVSGKTLITTVEPVEAGAARADYESNMVVLNGHVDLRSADLKSLPSTLRMNGTIALGPDTVRAINGDRRSRTGR